ncbi:hypothetical protein [Caudoviricetes sp.]|nr:hypothetical protein [Caudoviricetes sp.]UOF79130.1 hypothetical protein [Caudoviricetes sp.]
MERNKKHKITFDRAEVTWFYRKCKGAFDEAENIMKLFSNKDNLGSVEKSKLETAQFGGPMLLEMTRLLESTLNKGAQERLGMEARRSELKSVLELAEEQFSKDAAQLELDALPKAEPYDFTMDRSMVKFFLEMVEKDIENIRVSVIPAHEKADEATYSDPLFPRSYYVNKAKKTKTMLEKMRGLLEKEL